MQYFKAGIKRFIDMDSDVKGGVVMLVAALLALLVANTNLNVVYDYLLNQVDFIIGFEDRSDGALEIKKSILLWVNDGLMVIFFFLVGLEIKREMVADRLFSREFAVLPVLGAVGGMVVPIALFWVINRGDAVYLQGWAVPAATDIAFALAVLAFLNHRIPRGLKLMLAAIAVIDDLGAILIIAFFYTDKVIWEALYVAGFCVAGLFVLNRKHVIPTAPYVLFGAILWLAILESGVHATMAGVITALFIPLTGHEEYSHCRQLEHKLRPWVSYGILPLFAFANAGVSFAGIGLVDLFHPVSFGIFVGLVFGKQMGIFLMLRLAVLSGLAPKPKGVTWGHLYGVSVLCGIGFTMSLFVGELAYEGHVMQVYLRVGVLAASFISAIFGYAVLRYVASYNETGNLLLLTRDRSTKNE